MVLEGSLKLIVGRIVTRKSNIEHIGCNAILLEVQDVREYISLVDPEFLSYIPFSTFSEK